MENTSKLKDDPLWYQDAIIYQVHVKSYCDSTGDGIGDFVGLMQKLPHIERLGINAIWLLPFYPSPLRDDGYDIADYYDVNPQYGTLDDFKSFLNEAHRRGIRVITELVINHTSDQHAWFQRARLAPPGSPERDFYVWSDTTEKYKDARIIFKDFENSNWSWDPVAKAYYWHRFYSHQPDLNFDNPLLQEELLKVADFWLSMGVDGLRLDAIPYLYEREGTNCENLPETYEFLKKFRAHIDSKHKNKMLLAEANQWPEDAVAYFGEGKACHMAFHFPVMPRMFMSLQMEESFPIMDILDQTPLITQGCQWAIFLRNHDELTLEMVTDEERDYMYRAYARDPRTKINLGIRRRLVPLLGGNRRKVELMNILLFSLIGSPIVYYGDEIGMGDNYYLGDRNGVRTPMQWNADKNAGFSKANPQSLYLPVIIDPEYHYESINVEAQEMNLSSPLWWMRRVIGMRKKYKAFSRGATKFPYCRNPKVLAFIREYGEETILVVANLSRFAQMVEIDLAEYGGRIPEELFSLNKFYRIDEKKPYVLTLGPHSHYWLVLKKDKAAETLDEKSLYQVTLSEDWHEVLEAPVVRELEEKVLPAYFMKSRWFNRKTSAMRDVIIEDKIFLTHIDVTLLIVRVYFMEGAQEVYFVPVCFKPKADAHKQSTEFPQSLLCCLIVGGNEGYLLDAAPDPKFHEAILDLMTHQKRMKGEKSMMFFYHTNGSFNEPATYKSSHLVRGEQSNSSVVYGQDYMLKLFRRVEEGLNADLEITQFLTEKTKLQNIPAFLGGIEYRGGHEPAVLAVLTSFVQNHGDGWSYALDKLDGYYEQLLSLPEKLSNSPTDKYSIFDLDLKPLGELLQGVIDPLYIEMIKILGQRTREMHDALASRPDDANFAPEPFSTLYQRSIYQSIRSQTARVFRELNKEVPNIHGELQKEVLDLVLFEKEIIQSFQSLMSKKFAAQKIRIHGDYHLGQVLFTGKDFVIVDFEGEPTRPISERRLKRSPLRDVAGMIRSFQYAAYVSLLKRFPAMSREFQSLDPWAQAWYAFVSRAFLKAYLHSPSESSYLPQDIKDVEVLLQNFLLEKAIYELHYELNNRPDWIHLPIKGIKSLIKLSRST